MSENYEPKLGIGNVPVTIGNEQMELVPTYAAMVKINSLGGGLRGVLERILQLEAETIIEVLTAGLGYGPAKRPPKDLHERMWRTGFTLTSGGLADAAFQYVTNLANGGRPPASAQDDTGGGEAGGDTSPPPTPPQ